MKQWRNLLLAVVSSLITGGLLFVYGWIYGFEDFINVCFLGQTGKNLGMDIIRTLFTSPHTIWTNDTLGYTWVFFLWICCFAYLNKMSLAAKATIVVYFLTLLGSTDKVFFFGWYRVPFDPFLSIGAGMALTQAWKRLELHWFILFPIMVLLGALTIAYPEFKQPDMFRIAIVALCAPVFAGFLMYKYKPGQWYLKCLLIAMLAAMVYLGWRIVWLAPTLA
jgi:hypothetical protein